MNFNDRQTIASEKWDKLKTKKGIIIYVGAASCGRAAGCDAVTEAIKEYLKKHNLKADILEVGCIGLCCFEPLVYIQKNGELPICYANLDPKIIPELLEDVLMKNKLREDLALGMIGEKAYGSIPSIYDYPMLKPQVRIVLRNCGIINPNDIDRIPYLAPKLVGPRKEELGKLPTDTWLKLNAKSPSLFRLVRWNLFLGAAKLLLKLSQKHRVLKWAPARFYQFEQS